MTRLLDFQIAALTVAGLAALALGLAVASQVWGGLVPCPLCLEQRLPYYATVPAALAAAFVAQREPVAARLLLGAAGLVLLYNTGLGIYHAGIEWRWWPGPAECSGSGSFSGDAAEMLRRLRETPVVRCDEAQFRLLGLSLAGMSAILSAALATLALLASARRLAVRRSSL